MSEERKELVRTELERVVGFYADRYDTVVPEFTLYFSLDLEPVAALFKERHGVDAPLAPGFGGGWVANRRDATPEMYVAADYSALVVDVLAHEYYHVLQFHLLLSLADGPRSVPGWLIEGGARYGETLYLERKSSGRPEFIWRWELLARADTPFTSVMRNEAPHKELALGGVINAGLEPHYYDMAASGVAWLVANSGNNSADLEYWRALAETDDWQSAFASTFGMTVDDFVDVFAEYRRDLGENLPRISGVVVDLQGEPIAGEHISIAPRGNLTSAPRVTAEDGSFAVPVLEESEYVILLGRALRSSPDLPVASVFSDLFVDPESGEVNRCGALSFVDVARESVTDLVVRVLPELLTRQDKPVCNEGRPGWVLLSGVVLDPDREPLGNTIWVCAWGDLEDDRIGCSKNAADGPFTVAVPDGAISLQIGMEVPIDENRFTIVEWWYREGDVTTEPEERTEIAVGGANIEGIEIRLPGPPYDIPAFE